MVHVVAFHFVSKLQNMSVEIFCGREVKRSVEEGACPTLKCSAMSCFLVCTFPCSLTLLDDDDAPSQPNHVLGAKCTKNLLICVFSSFDPSYLLHTCTHSHIKTMIRPRPTQIGISPRDLTWHIERHENRQALRANNCPVEMIGSPARALPETPGKPKQKSTVPDHFAGSPSIKKSSSNVDSDMDSFSTEPISRSSSNFRDSNLAQANISAGLKIQNVEKRPRIIEQSHHQQAIIRSSRASIQEDNRNNTGPYVDALDINHSRDLSYEAEMAPHLRYRSSSASGGSFEAGMEPHLQSHFSSESGGSTEADEEQERIDGSNLPRGSFVLPIRSSAMRFNGERLGRTVNRESFTLPIRSSATLSNGERLDRTVNGEDSPMSQYGSSRHFELDGTSDHELDYPYQGKDPWMVDREAEPDLIQYSAQPLRVGSGAYSSRGYSLDATGSARIGTESLDQFSSPRLPLPQSVDTFRRRSGCPRRSQLYISQAAASSSPERHLGISSELNSGSSGESVLHDPGLITQPPHRRQNCETPTGRSTSQASQVSQYLRLDRLSLDGPLENSLYSGSPNSASVNNNRQTSATLSPNALLSSSPESFHRDIGPYVLPRHHLSSPTRSPPSLPPFPFSATPRKTSFNRDFVSRSTTSFSSSIPTRSQGFTIYDDRRPASSQPQTPARLPRNGVSTQDSFDNGIGAQTEPRGRRRERLEGVTPTRRGRTAERRTVRRTETDQENVGVLVEAERMRTRLRTWRGRNALGPGHEWIQEEWPPEDFEAYE